MTIRTSPAQRASMSAEAASFLAAAPSNPIPSFLAPWFTSPRMAIRFRDRYQREEDKVEESLIARYQLRVEPATIAGVRVLHITPPEISPALDDVVVLNVHGGGFFLGTARDRPGLMIARELGVRVVSVDYTLAPEAAFPVALDECLSVYRHLVDHGPARIVGVSTSAGGAIQLGMVHKARAQELPLPAALGLFTPGADLSGAGDSGEANGNGRDTESLSFSLGFIRLYIGDADPRDPLVSPLYGTFDSAFPPTVMVTGTRDFNMSASIRLHDKLVRANGYSSLHVAEGMWHGFTYQPDLPEAVHARGLVNRFILDTLTLSG